MFDDFYWLKDYVIQKYEAGYDIHAIVKKIPEKFCKTTERKPYVLNVVYEHLMSQKRL